MSKKFNFWFCLSVGIPTLIGGISRLIKYMDKLIDVIFHGEELSIGLLVGYPIFLLVIIGTSYVIIRIGLEQRQARRRDVVE